MVSQLFCRLNTKSLTIQFWAIPPSSLAQSSCTGIHIDITVSRHNTLLAQYRKVFDQIPAVSRYQQFIKDFLAIPAYRLPYLVHGNWEGRVFCQSPTGIPLNPCCVSTIQYLNSLKGAISRSALAQLKTAGLDGISRLREPALRRLISAQTFTLVQRAAIQFQWSHQQFLTCLRWTARGLRPILALQKVNVDRQLQLQEGMYARYRMID